MKSLYELLMLKVRSKKEVYKKHYFNIKNMDTFDEKKQKDLKEKIKNEIIQKVD